MTCRGADFQKYNMDIKDDPKINDINIATEPRGDTTLTEKNKTRNGTKSEVHKQNEDKEKIERNDAEFEDESKQDNVKKKKTDEDTNPPPPEDGQTQKRKLSKIHGYDDDSRSSVESEGKVFSEESLGFNMSSADQKQRIQVPDALREVLLEFSIAYLLEQPGDVVDYAVLFFTKLQESRKAAAAVSAYPREPSSPDESIMSQEDEPVVQRFAGRRKSVFAEAYDPENDADEDEGATAVFPKTDEQRSRLVESVKNVLLFRSLEKEQMNQVLDAMFEKRVQPGDFIIIQGADGDNFYVIESGVYKVIQNDKHVHTYNNNGIFGELALLYNMPRAATIQAETAGQLWAMDRQTFRRILLKSAFKKRKMYESLLDSVPMLKALQNYERMNLADALVTKRYKDNERIIKQGEDADGMYFIEEGQVSVKMDQEGGEIEISKLGKGQYFGELALVTHRPRAASVYAVGDVKVACLDVQAFERLLGPCMDIMKRNIDDYETQLVKIFGSKNNITDTR